MKTTFPVLFILAILTSCSLLGNGDDDRPDIPSKIVFSADDNSGASQIYTINADDSGLRQLTSFPPEGGAANPAWSPDGQRIVFANFTKATSLGPYLYVMDADGDNMRPLKRRQSEAVSALVGSAPTWSPDGTHIAFQVCTNCELGGNNYEISAVEVAGTDYDPDQIHTVTDHPASDTNPTWNPDGSQIAFVSDRDYVEADTLRWRTDMYMINSNGSSSKRLTENGFVGRSAWHPENTYIAFAANGLHLLNMSSESSLKIELDLPAEFQQAVRPVKWSNNAKTLLLVVTENNRKTGFYLFNNDENTINRIPFDTRKISGADWFISNDN